MSLSQYNHNEIKNIAKQVNTMIRAEHKEKVKAAVKKLREESKERIKRIKAKFAEQLKKKLIPIAKVSKKKLIEHLGKHPDKVQGLTPQAPAPKKKKPKSDPLDEKPPPPEDVEETPEQKKKMDELFEEAKKTPLEGKKKKDEFITIRRGGKLVRIAKKDIEKARAAKKAKPKIPKITITDVPNEGGSKFDPKATIGKIKEKPVKLRVAPKKEPSAEVIAKGRKEREESEKKRQRKLAQREEKIKQRKSFNPAAALKAMKKRRKEFDRLFPLIDKESLSDKDRKFLKEAAKRRETDDIDDIDLAEMRKMAGESGGAKPPPDSKPKKPAMKKDSRLIKEFNVDPETQKLLLVALPPEEAYDKEDQSELYDRMFEKYVEILKNQTDLEEIKGKKDEKNLVFDKDEYKLFEYMVKNNKFTDKDGELADLRKAEKQREAFEKEKQAADRKKEEERRKALEKLQKKAGADPQKERQKLESVRKFEERLKAVERTTKVPEEPPEESGGGAAGVTEDVFMLPDGRFGNSLESGASYRTVADAKAGFLDAKDRKRQLEELQKQKPKSNKLSPEEVKRAVIGLFGRYTPENLRRWKIQKVPLREGPMGRLLKKK